MDHNPKDLYVVERGGVEFYKRFLKLPGLSDEEDGFGPLRGAHHFENVNEAHCEVRKSGLTCRVILTDGPGNKWEPIYDNR
ncbi:hypothetical protein CL634_10655 [bacterium]|nr:hypothetical protein [bacterium]